MTKSPSSINIAEINEKLVISSDDVPQKTNNQEAEFSFNRILNKFKSILKNTVTFVVNNFEIFYIIIMAILIVYILSKIFRVKPYIKEFSNVYADIYTIENNQKLLKNRIIRLEKTNNRPKTHTTTPQNLLRRMPEVGEISDIENAEENVETNEDM